MYFLFVFYFVKLRNKRIKNPLYMTYWFWNKKNIISHKNINSSLHDVHYTIAFVYMM